MSATYFLYADYYAMSCQWGRTRIAYLTYPAELGAWAKKAGFNRRVNFTVWQGNNAERYILAFARTTPVLVTMDHHINRMLRAGGDDYAISMAYQCEADVKRWAGRAARRGHTTMPVGPVNRGNAALMRRATGDGAERLGYPLRALANSADLPTEGAGRWPD